MLLFSSSVVSDSATPWTAIYQASLSFIITWSLLKIMSIMSMMSSNHLILYYLLLLPSIFPRIRVFSNELTLHVRWPKYWSISFSTSPSNEYSGFISFKINWFDILAVQGTLKSPPVPQFEIINPAPRFESINSSALSLLYGPTLTFKHGCF